MPTIPTKSRPQHHQPTACIVMLRSIFIKPYLSQLKHLQFARYRNPTPFNHNKHQNYRRPTSNTGSMTDVLEILGPFDHILPSDSEICVGLLRKCIRSKNLSMGSCLQARSIKSGFEADILVSNVLLDMYAKVGFLDGCIKLFDEMPERDLISWCTLMTGCVNHGLDLEAYELFNRMRESALRPNHFVISSVLKGCSASGVLELGLLVHGLVAKSGLGFDRFVEIGLVDMYAKCGSLDDALKLFHEIPVKCSVAWNAMISGYAQNACYIEAAELCQEMCRTGFVMDLVTLRVVANAGSALEMLDFCKNIHVYSIKIGLDADNFVVAELVRLLSKLGEVAYIGKLFNRVKKPDASLYSLLISGYHLHGHRGEAVKLAEELLDSDLNPMQGALVSVLNLCLCKEEGMQIHAHILKTGHGSHLSVSNAMISMYIKFGNTVDAKVIFIRMPIRDVISWTAVMAGLVQNLCFEEALDTFHAFRETGILLDQHSVVTTINACTGLRAIGNGKQIHALALKFGFEFSDYLNASLLHLYAKCGYIESAARLFSHTSSPHDLISTNVMLFGYCWNVEPHKALELFSREYRSGLVPDHFSFSTLLGACADIRSLEVGEQIHGRISKSGFEFSDVIIGNAIINMYVRSGSIVSACRFFYSMRKRNVNSYAMLMLGYIQNKGSSEALRLFYQMQQSGLHANPVAFARILRGCSDLLEIDLGKQIHASIIKMGLVSDVYVANALVGMYAKSRFMMSKARETIQEMSISDDVLGKPVIAGYSQHENKYRTLKALGLFTLDEIKEDYCNYADVSNICAIAASFVHERSVLSHVVRTHLIVDMSANASMVVKHFKCSTFGNSWNVLSNMPLRDVALGSALICEYAQNGCGNMELSKAINKEKITPDFIIYLVVFPTCTRVCSVDEISSSFKTPRVSCFGETGRALCLHG